MYEQRNCNFLLSTAAKGEHAVGYVQTVFPKLRGISAHQGRDIVNSMLCAGEMIHTTVYTRMRSGMYNKQRVHTKVTFLAEIRFLLATAAKREYTPFGQGGPL